MKMKVILISIPYKVVPPKYLRSKTRKQCSSRHLALFTDKHAARTNHKHKLIFLESMVNELRIYGSHEFSVTW